MKGINKMKYRDMLGFPKKKSKKKVIPQPSKPSVTKKLKEELNEWNDTTFKKLPKRWSKPFNSELTEFEKQGGKDNVNEGPAYDYSKQWDNVKKTYGAFWDAVHDLESLLNSKGMGRDAKKVNQLYKKNVEGFYKYIYKLIGKLM